MDDCTAEAAKAMAVEWPRDETCEKRCAELGSAKARNATAIRDCLAKPCTDYAACLGSVARPE